MKMPGTHTRVHWYMADYCQVHHKVTINVPVVHEDVGYPHHVDWYPDCRDVTKLVGVPDEVICFPSLQGKSETAAAAGL